MSTPTVREMADKVRKSKIKKETIRILRDFLQKYGDKIIENTKKCKDENGQGALFVTLVPDSDVLDMEYFKMEDLDGKFKKKILEDVDSNNSVYYAINLYKKTYRFQKKLN